MRVRTCVYGDDGGGGGGDCGCVYVSTFPRVCVSVCLRVCMCIFLTEAKILHPDRIDYIISCRQ